MLQKLVITPAEKVFYFSGSDGVKVVSRDSLTHYKAEALIKRFGDCIELNNRVTVYKAPISSGADSYSNYNRCLSIAIELDRIADGDCYICPECGEICTYEEAENDEGETAYICDCGCKTDYEPDPYSFYNYFDEYYNVEYRVSGPHADYINSVEVMVACGGPNIYIDTADCKVKLFWWGERAEAEFSRSTADEIEYCFNELWRCC